MQVPQNRLDRGFLQHQSEYEQKAIDILRSGWYVLGQEVESFENEFAEYVGSKYCVGLASGLDALWIAFRALGIGAGDEVIVQANTYIASVMGVTINGATPIFIEPDTSYQMDTKNIEEKITDKTKAILVVHLYGMVADMGRISELCKTYNLRLIEDCAQSHGAMFEKQMTGTFGDVGCFSFYPSKNLGAFGDAGAIVTNNADVAKFVTMFRNYGSEKRYYNKVVGANSRLDEMQAGLLRVRLSHMDEITVEREQIAKRYYAEIKNPLFQLPTPLPNTKSVWHQFVVRCDYRDTLAIYLKENGIGTIIHYPIPPHLADAYTYLGFHDGDLPITEKLAKEVLSLPIFNGMTIDEQSYVIEKLNQFEVKK